MTEMWREWLWLFVKTFSSRQYLPCPKSFPLHEVMFFDGVTEIQSRHFPSPRIEMHTALNDPYQYLKVTEYLAVSKWQENKVFYTVYRLFKNKILLANCCQFWTDVNLEILFSCFQTLFSTWVSFGLLGCSLLISKCFLLYVIITIVYVVQWITVIVARCCRFFDWYHFRPPRSTLTLQMWV